MGKWVARDRSHISQRDVMVENSPPPECSHPYLSINPWLFDSSEHWSYRDLQRLAKRLDLPANGKREEIVYRLQTWHRETRGSDQAGKFLGVEIRAAPGGHPVSPRLLAPLSVPSPSPGSILSSSKAQRIGRSPLHPTTGVAFSPVTLPVPAVAWCII